jgi:hypothetical protein
MASAEADLEAEVMIVAQREQRSEKPLSVLPDGTGMSAQLDAAHCKITDIIPLTFIARAI